MEYVKKTTRFEEMYNRPLHRAPYEGPLPWWDPIKGGNQTLTVKPGFKIWVDGGVDDY